MKVEGIIPALITPMNEDETVSEGGLRTIVDHVIGGGVHGIFVLGSQGESFALTLEIMDSYSPERTRNRGNILLTC